MKLQKPDYNIVWTTPGRGSEDSMPLGGYDTGCNVWTENKDLCLYLSQSGAFDENGTLLKAGRIRLTADRADFGRAFRQELHVEEGYLTVDAGELHFCLWASTEKPEIHIEFSSESPCSLRLAFECWRYREREITEEEKSQCRDRSGVRDDASELRMMTLPDTVLAHENELVFFHRTEGESELRKMLIRQQKMEPAAHAVPDPLKNRTAGGLIRPGTMRYTGKKCMEYAGTDCMAYQFQADATMRQEIVITLHTGQYDQVEDWKRELEAKSAVWSEHSDAIRWWKEYFGRSYIYVDRKRKSPGMYQIGRNYQLFRYMLGCNYYGSYPTKFNGGLFTFDTKGKTPDFRQWSGSGFTSQNQRLVYWGMLKTGDFEGMKPQLDYWTGLTETGRQRTRLFYGHGGAYFFEQGNIFGLCTAEDYSYGGMHSSRVSPGEEDNPWVRMHYSSGLEFALMMLEYGRYSGRSIEKYLDYIESVVEFYFEHYPSDQEGRLMVFPSTALETYKRNPYGKDAEEYGAVNPTDAVAGLRCLTDGLMRYFQSGEKYEKYRKYRERCPNIATGTGASGEKIYLPAEKYDPKPFNCELPQLYPVFPYSPYGMGEEQKKTAAATYREKYASPDQYLGISWHQNGIFAARLGECSDAFRYLHIKLDDGPVRFPAFWGPGHDWIPDHNQGGSGMIELQEMLLQTEENRMILLPCWDRSVDVAFRLYAPDNTVVECVWEDGRLCSLHVTPKEREKDVVLWEERRE